MLHISKVNHLTEKKDERGKPVPFSFTAISSKGELIQGSNCIVTSSNYRNNSRNIKFLDSGEIIKLRYYSFIEINGIEITL